MKINIDCRTLVFFLFLAVHPFRGATTPDSLELIRLKEVSQEQSQEIQTLTLQVKTLEENLKTVNELAETIKKPSSLIWRLGLPFVIGVFIALALWRALLWLEPKWFTKFIQRLVEKYEETNVLKSKKSIAILMPELQEGKANNRDFIHSFFGAKEFEKITYLNDVSQYAPLEKPTDLIFANNEYGGLKQEVLEDYLTKNPQAYLFYFGSPGSWDFKRSPELNKRVNLANARSQIYGNLLSTLKLQDLSTPKISL